MRSVETSVAALDAPDAVPTLAPPLAAAATEPIPIQTSRSHPSAGLAVLMIVGSGFLTQLLTTVTGILSARMLGVEGRGQIVLVASLAMMTSQLTLGGLLPNALTRELADRGVTARDGLRRLVPQWALWSVVPSAIAGGYFLFLERHSSGSTKLTLAIIVALMAIQTMASRIMVGAMLGEGADLINIAMTSVLPQAVVTVALGAAFVLGLHWSVVTIALVTLGCMAVVLVGRLRLLKKPSHRAQDELDAPRLYRLARRTYIGSVGPIDGLSLDRTLVGSLMGSVALGLYSVAFAMAAVTFILGGCLAMVILPRITVAQKDPDAERHLVRRWLLLSAVLIASAVAFLELIAGWAIRVTFGPEFVGATACTRWLLLASGILDFRKVLIAILQGRNLGGRASVIELGLTPVVIVGIVVASAHDSLVGVSLAMGAVGVVGCVLLGIAVARSGPGSRARYVPLHSHERQRPA